MADDFPTEQEFRDVGFTKHAVNHPLSDRAIAWVRKFNGVPEGYKEPRAWHYAPNQYMQTMVEQLAAKDIDL